MLYTYYILYMYMLSTDHMLQLPEQPHYCSVHVQNIAQNSTSRKTILLCGQKHV